MAVYGENYDDIRRRNQSYFPAVNFGLRPGVAEGRVRMDQIAQSGTFKSRRDALATYNLPSGGTARVNTGNRVSSYAQPMINNPTPAGTASFTNPTPNEAMFPSNIPSTQTVFNNPIPNESLFPTNVQQPLFPNLGVTRNAAANVAPSQLPYPPSQSNRFQLNFTPTIGGGRSNSAIPTPTPQRNLSNVMGGMLDLMKNQRMNAPQLPGQPRRYFDS